MEKETPFHPLTTSACMPRAYWGLRPVRSTPKIPIELVSCPPLSSSLPDLSLKKKVNRVVNDFFCFNAQKGLRLGVDIPGNYTDCKARNEVAEVV